MKYCHPPNWHLRASSLVTLVGANSEALFGTVMDIDKMKDNVKARVDPKVTISRWVCCESEEGSEPNYYANQWAQES